MRRLLRLGSAQRVGEESVALDDIIGSVGRAADFDTCFHPRNPTLAARIDDIGDAHPDGLSEAIDVVRIDRAVFVVDGHKRVSLARRAGRSYIDAHVSEIPTAFELTADVAREAIANTARELRFRDATGLRNAEPAARFALSSADAYDELGAAFEASAASLRAESDAMSRDEIARAWYRGVYLPTIEAARREGVSALLRSSTDAALFLAMDERNRQGGADCTICSEGSDIGESSGPSSFRRALDRVFAPRPPQLLDLR